MYLVIAYLEYNGEEHLVVVVVVIVLNWLRKTNILRLIQSERTTKNKGRKKTLLF